MLPLDTHDLRGASLRSAYQHWGTRSLKNVDPIYLPMPLDRSAFGRGTFNTRPECGQLGTPDFIRGASLCSWSALRRCRWQRRRVGFERGNCAMIGGEHAIFERLDTIFRSLATGVQAAPRTSDAAGEPVRRSTATCIADTMAPAAPVIATALFARFGFPSEAAYEDELLSALCFQFGGHAEKAAK